MWESVKKYFSWNEKTSDNNNIQSDLGKEDDTDMSLERDSESDSSCKEVDVYEGRRLKVKNYFDEEYLDLIINEGEDGGKFRHFNTEDGYKSFNELVEKAGIADLNRQLLMENAKKVDVYELPGYTNQNNTCVADGFKNEAQEGSKDDIDYNLIETKESRKNFNDSSNGSKIVAVDSESGSKSVESMEISQTIFNEESDIYEDKATAKNISTPQYYYDVLPDVSSDETSGDESLTELQMRESEHSDNEFLTKKSNSQDLNSTSTLSGVLNDQESKKLTEELLETLPSPTTDLGHEKTLLVPNEGKSSTWNPTWRSMPELGFVSTAVPERVDAERMSVSKEIEENDRHPKKSKTISSASGNSESEEEVVDMESYDEKILHASHNRTLDSVAKMQRSVDLLTGLVNSEDKDISQEQGEISKLMAKSTVLHSGELKSVEVNASLSKESNENEVRKELYIASANPSTANEERRIYVNSCISGQEEECSKSHLKEEEKELKVDSVSNMSFFANKMPKHQAGESVPHKTVEDNKDNDDCDNIDNKNSQSKEQMPMKIMMERGLNVGLGPANNSNDNASGSLVKENSVSMIKNEQEAISDGNIYQKRAYEELTHSVYMNAKDSVVNIEEKLGHQTPSIMPKVVVEHRIHSCGPNHQIEELKNERTKIHNHSPSSQDLSHNPIRWLLPGTSPVGTTISAVEMKMENGVMMLNITPSRQDVENSFHEREISNSKAKCNCSLISKKETGTQTEVVTDMERIQNQNTLDYSFQQSAGSRIHSDVSSEFIANKWSRVQNLSMKADSQQLSLKKIEENKVKVGTENFWENDSNIGGAESRVAPKRSLESRLLASTLISPRDIGIQVDEECFNRSSIHPDRSLDLKLETATQTSSVELSRIHNSITIPDLQRTLRNIFGGDNQSNVLLHSKVNAETQTPFPIYIASTSFLNNSEVEGWSTDAVPFHKSTRKTHGSEVSDDESLGKYHCACSVHVPCQLGHISPISSILQNNSTPKKGSKQIKKLLDISRSSRLEFKSICQQTSKTVSKNQSNIMDTSQSVIESNHNGCSSIKCRKVTVHSPKKPNPSCPFVTYVETPTSRGSLVKKTGTTVKVNHSGGKTTSQRSGDKSLESKGCFNLGNTSINCSVLSGVEKTVSPSKVADRSNSLLVISYPSNFPLSIERREIVIEKRPLTANTVIESTRGNAIAPIRRVLEIEENPVANHSKDNILKQEGLAIHTGSSVLKTVLENSDEKALTKSHRLSALVSDNLDEGRLAKSAEENRDNEMVGKDLQGLINQTTEVPLYLEDQSYFNISSCEKHPVTPKYPVGGTCNANIEDTSLEASSIKNTGSIREEPGSKPTLEEEKEKNESTSKYIIPKKDTDHMNHKVKTIKEECRSVNIYPVGNSFKSEPAQSSNHNENVEKERSSDNDISEKVYRSLCLRKREETSRKSLDAKKKIENVSPKILRRSVVGSKLELEPSSVKFSRKRKHPIEIVSDHMEKRKTDNSLPRSSTLTLKKKVRMLRNKKEF